MSVIAAPLNKPLDRPGTPSMVLVSVSGPSSYPSGGFEVSIAQLRRVLMAGVINVTGGYKARVESISGNTVKIVVEHFDYDATADGPAIEVPSGTDLSGVDFLILAVGEP